MATLVLAATASPASPGQHQQDTGSGILPTLALAATAPPAPSPVRESGEGGSGAASLAGSQPAPPVCRSSSTVESQPWIASDPDVQRLMHEFPIGTRVIFRGYHPTIWPRSWRRMAERAPWGLRPGDRLQVEGYGASYGFPEALLCRRLSDAVRAMVFFPEVIRAEERPAAQEVSPAGSGTAETKPALAGAGQEGAERPPGFLPASAEPDEREATDPVIVASEESFPASDPPAWVPAHVAALAGAGTQ